MENLMLEKESVSNNAEKQEVKRVLWLSDFGCSTGFAVVAQNILAQLLKSKKYQVDVVGINYNGMPNDWQFAYDAVRQFPAAVLSRGDVFGREAFLNMLSTGVYDIAFILQDTFQIEPIGEQIIKLRNDLVANGKKSFKWIFYFPIDAEPKENWLTKSVLLADIPVAYTQYGYNECVKKVPALANKLRIVNHGTDIDTFKPLPEDQVAKFRKNYFMGRADDRWLITNVNRNQPRKDIARTLQIFSLVKKQVPDAMLYLHMKENDVGYGLCEVARNFELQKDIDFIVPASFNEHDGVSPQVLNYIYNASQLVMTTTLGEGWGLSVTEAMAVKTPVVAPRHTSLVEMCGENEERASLVTAGKHVSDWFIQSMDNERLRPLCDIPEYVDKIVKIRQNYQTYKDKAEVAFNYLVENWTWAKIGAQWQEIFDDVLKIPDQKLGRNDPCFCGSGKKYKICHGSQQ